MPPPDVMAQFEALADAAKKRSTRILRRTKRSEKIKQVARGCQSSVPRHPYQSDTPSSQRGYFQDAMHQKEGRPGKGYTDLSCGTTLRTATSSFNSQPQHTHRCIVDTCTQRGHFFVSHDGFGGPGYRCLKHSRTCFVKGCMKPGKREVSASDAHGPAGLRCMIHGGAESCGVPGCEAIAWRRKGPDKFGDGGLRCSKHAQPCVIEGCTKAGQRRARADKLAPEGYRCWKHYPKAERTWTRFNESGLQVE